MKKCKDTPPPNAAGDGRNPKNQLILGKCQISHIFTGFHTCQVVRDFFHQQYPPQSGNKIKNDHCSLIRHSYPCTPLKINMEPNHGGLEDHVSFQNVLKNR